MRAKQDIFFAKLVSIGDDGACKIFVNDYTDLVLSKVWKLMKTHCHYPARKKVCSLIILQKQRKGTKQPLPFDQCDECLDSYIWFFDFLKKKVKSYQGINNCSLKTYVWSITNSHSTYIEWLRWRYGRIY
ncbi:MAG TPA: hypothetical protein VMW42_11820 [Desulfatiglandales bacterium]|nr:hypothetical protein [Desulfatiglandales bacterium]